VRAQRHGFWPALRRPSRKIHSEPCFVGWGGCFFLGGVPREQKESPPTVLYRRHDFFIILVAKKDTLPANWHPIFWHMTDNPHSMALRVGWRLGGAMQRIEAGGRNKSGVERHPLFILIASSRIAHWNSWFSGGLPAVTVHPLGRCGPWPEQQQPPARRSRKPIRDTG